MSAVVRSWGLAVALVAGLATAALADRDSDMAELIELMKFDETLDIMREEGLGYGEVVAADMLPGVDMDGWNASVSRIYDTGKMDELVTTRFIHELEGTDLGPILAYFRTGAAREIVGLEVSARQAFLLTETEEAAMALYEEMKDEGAPLLAQLDVLIADSDLVEMNVMGTLNSSLMFYRGLSDGGALDMAESEMLADVWAQEDETREDSTQWLGSFLAMAYQPLTPEQLEGYAAFYRTREGRDLNRALFAGFDQMYEEVSYLLGLAVARHMTSEPI